MIIGDAVDIESFAKGSELKKDGVCGVLGVAGVRRGNSEEGELADVGYSDVRGDLEYRDEVALAVQGRLKSLVAEGDEVLLWLGMSVDGEGAEEVEILSVLGSWEKRLFAVEGRLKPEAEDGPLEEVDKDNREG